MSSETPIRPIRNEADYESALEQIDLLIDAQPGTEEGDRLEVISLLVEVYEQEHYPIDPPDPIEAIKFRMEQQGLTRKDLEPIFGSRARVSEVLGGKRGLSLRMIRRLHDELGIPLDVLVQQTTTKAA
jgi:HTH-type transcriptional regulator / antitoxin HigA